MFKFNQRKRLFLITKRHRFIIGVLLSSILLFTAEYSLGKSGIFLVFVFSLLTDIFLYWALKEDLRDNLSPQVFILPFLFTLGVGLAYFLLPARLIIRLVYTFLYAIGLYSLFLTENIFTVSSIRTIALLSSARTVSYVVSILSYLGFTVVVFSLQISPVISPILIFLVSLPITLHSIWTYTLEKDLRPNLAWGILISLCLSEVSVLLSFWPSTPLIRAAFLATIFYILIGLTDVWFDKRLFRGVILEYLWVSVISFFVLVFFTSW